MDKWSKIFLVIIIILLVILVIMTVSYLKMKNTVKENLNEVLEIAEENMRLNARISELEEKNNTNSIASVTNSSNMTMPNSNVTINNNSVLPNEVPEEKDYSIDTNYVKIEVDKSTITPTCISIIITNNNENDLSYGEEFKIQKNINGKWKDLDYASDKLYWNTIALITNGKSQTSKKLDIEHYYGKLDNGTYRVVKSVFNGNGGEVEIYSDEFEIE